MGCGYTNPLPAPEIPANLTSACDDPSPMAFGSNFGDVMNISIDNGVALRTCKLKHQCLVSYLLKSPKLCE
jgi:hypothetical protein